MGYWEEELVKLAGDEADVTAPNLPEFQLRTEDLKKALSAVAADPGLGGGEAGAAAAMSFGNTADHARTLADWLEELQAIVKKANSQRKETANELLNKLPDGQAPLWMQAQVGLEEAGQHVIFGGLPFAVISGASAIAALNGHYAAQREDAAQDAVRTVSTGLDRIGQDLEISGLAVIRRSTFPVPGSDPILRGPGGTSEGAAIGASGATLADGRSGGSSFDDFPNAGIRPSSQFDHGGAFAQLPPEAHGLPEGTVLVAERAADTADAPGGRHGAWGGRTLDGALDADGPMGSGSTDFARSGDIGQSGGSQPGWGGGALNGAISGMGGAAALGGTRLMSNGTGGAGSGGNSTGGHGRGGGLGPSASGSRGLLGARGASGGGQTGTWGVGGSGQAASGAGAAGAGASGLGGAGGAQGGISMLGAGAPAVGPSQEKQRPRGLGLFAPKFDDEDDEPKPRSPAAGPGCRENRDVRP